MVQFDQQLKERLSDRLRARWRGPRSFTAILPMPGVTFAELNARLNRLSSAMLQALGEVSDLHSFRLCGVPPERHSTAETHLLINFVHDRPLAEHVPQLLHAAGDLLCEALANPGQPRTPADLVSWLIRYRVRENTLHLGTIGLTLPEILAHRRLRTEVEQFADRQLASGKWTAETPAEIIRLETQKHIHQLPQSANMPRGPIESLRLGARVLRFGDLLLAFLFPALGVLHTEIVPAIQRIPNRLKRIFYWTLYGAWWIYGAVPTALSFLGVRLLELIERDEVAPAPDESRLTVLESREDIDPKNEVTLWFPVRNSLIRRLLMSGDSVGGGTRDPDTSGRMGGYPRSIPFTTPDYCMSMVGAR